MTIKPLADRVVLKTVEAEEKTKAGILLTASAQEFVEKPYALNVFPHGEGKKAKDTVTLDNTAISLHVFKSSKNGGYILRLFNNGDKSQDCTVSVFGKEKKLTFKKFEIKTLKYDGEKIVETKEIEI